MQVTRINPEWIWNRALHVNITDTYISHTNTDTTTIPHEKPALHRTLMREFEKFLKSTEPTIFHEIIKGTTPDNHALYARKTFVTQRKKLIIDWYNAYGPLQVGFAAKLPNEIGVTRDKERPRRNRIDVFMEEAGAVWWVVNVLDRIGGIGAYHDCLAIKPKETSVTTANSLTIEVPNPMLTNINWGAAEAARKGEGVGQILQEGNKNIASPTWRVPYSSLLKWVIEYINQYLKENTYFTNENPWDVTRNSFGKKDIANANKTTGHRITTVAAPRNLSGYIWLLIQQQLEKTSNIDYYPCRNFENCAQELVGTSAISRRKWCSDACRLTSDRENKQTK